MLLFLFKAYPSCYAVILLRWSFYSPRQNKNSTVWECSLVWQLSHHLWNSFGVCYCETWSSVGLVSIWDCNFSYFWATKHELGMNQPKYVCCMYDSYSDTNQQLTILNLQNWPLCISTFLLINCFLRGDVRQKIHVERVVSLRAATPTTFTNPFWEICCHRKFIVSLGPSKGWKQCGNYYVKWSLVKFVWYFQCLMQHFMHGSRHEVMTSAQNWPKNWSSKFFLSSLVVEFSFCQIILYSLGLVRWWTADF